MTRTGQLTEPALNLQLANCKASTGAHTSGEARRGRCKKKRGLQKGKPEQRWPAGKEEAGGLTPRGTSLAGRYLRVVGVGVVVPPGGVQREDSTSGSQASPQGWPEGHTPTKSLPGPQQLARSPTKVPCNLYALSLTSQHRVPLTSPNKLAQVCWNAMSDQVQSASLDKVSLDGLANCVTQVVFPVGS